MDSYFFPPRNSSTKMKIPKLPIFLFAAWLLAILVSSTLMEEENASSEIEGNAMRELLMQRMFQPRIMEDSREADPKRAHVRRFEQFPPGFVGVRGKKEKSKSKDPVPGFLGVRGKKDSQLHNHRNYHPSNNIARYIQREFSKFKV
ncbi:uncharacterized protein LOC129959467 [Argiope bruennichi]|uniref:Uncharacterized protein n=1 Tax=Argiope bruennichi TaxID=94029 RepID=A0A8T0F554_ARGBR|nr:uncharacterized protein LOC129959467 [Argiope bruennichi]KAF8785552.1 hypothetical protein HNY73_011073 [Argiope bruennichi]